MIEFGASFHETSHKEYLINYVLGNYGHVFFGNDQPCYILGIGIVKIKLPNGGLYVVNKSKHIIYLKRNLISTRKLDTKGYIIEFKNSPWRFIRGSMVVYIGSMVGTLYFLTSIFNYLLN